MKKGSEKRQSELFALPHGSNDDINVFLNIHLYFWGAIVFWGLLRANISEMKVELFGA